MNTESNKYYIHVVEYVGPNQTDDRHINANYAAICTYPCTTNSSHEERTDGWCGTTNDWSLHALGVYETLDAAREAIQLEFGPVPVIDPYDIHVDDLDEDEVERYRLR